MTNSKRLKIKRYGLKFNELTFFIFFYFFYFYQNDILRHFLPINLNMIFPNGHTVKYLKF